MGEYDVSYNIIANHSGEWIWIGSPNPATGDMIGEGVFDI